MQNKLDSWYLGLDIGTASVGWAVTDEQYNIPRLRGQRAWGVRLFEEAQTAADRRLHRSARRRYFRRAERLKYLRQIFAPYIDPIDPGFFHRMADSFLWAEDKRESTPDAPQTNSLFSDDDYTDKDFYRDFPTIFHLRSYLMNPGGCTWRQAGWQPKKLDARHYYLAIHNIVKFRGHFLLPDDTEINLDTTKSKFVELYSNLQAAVKEIFRFEFTVVYITDKSGTGEITSERDFEEVLLEQVSIKGRLTGKKNTVKATGIDTELDEEDRERADKARELIVQFLVGGKVDFSKIAECESKAEIQLGQANTDDKMIEIIDKLGADWEPFLKAAKEIFDLGVARQIIGENESLSTSYITIYDNYKADLDLYNVSKSIKDEKQMHELPVPRVIPDDNGKNKEQKKIAKPKLRGYYKGAVPMQLHLAELKKILDSFMADGRYGTFRGACTGFKNDPSQVADSDKVIKLLTHKVPYYVGPLQKDQGEGKRAKTKRQEPWVERLLGQEDAKIYPWNFEMVVDKAASAENFIKRMTNKCTYLVDQPCLPKESVLYQRYMILNELNKLRIDGRIIDVQEKQDLFKELFMRKTDIRLSSVKAWFATRGIDGDIAMADSQGTGGTINHKMTSYLRFESVFGASTDKLLPQIEEAILAITILPDEKEMLLERLKTIFVSCPHGLSEQALDDAINRIAGFKFTKWGNFSAMLLDGIATNIGGQKSTIIQAMWDTNNNFMELIHGSFGFAQQIEAYQVSHGCKSDEELINDSYASVPIKRAARQAIKIVRELEQVIGSAPAKVFIETPRSREESRRTDDRKKQLAKLYDTLKADVAEYQATKDELGGYESVDLKPKALYLYFLQNGRCAYSGDELNIGTLSSDCDIDHIIPQTLIKDDSFDNLALVKKELNRAKSDTYPLNRVQEIDFAKMLLMWKGWYKNGLMGDKKLKSLSRTALSFDELAGFINRQLVETSQTTKMVMEILKLVMPDTEIVYQKAETVAEFKREWAQYEGKLVDGAFKPWLYLDGERLEDANGNPAFDPQGTKKLVKLIKPQFIKVRDLNDLHHAKDAYLNIVVGNVYSTKFTNNPLQWLREKYGDKPEAANKLGMRSVMYDDRKTLSDGSRGEVKSIPDSNGVIVWDKDCLNTVIETYERNDILVTVRSFKKSGAIYDQTIHSFEKDKIRFPIKKGMDVIKYGGYTGSYTSYFVYIKTSKGKKRFAPIPVRCANKSQEYLNTEFPGCDVLIDCIPIKSQLVVKGHHVILGGNSGTKMLVANFKNLILKFDDALYLSRVIKAKEKMNGNKSYSVGAENGVISKDRNLALYDLFLALSEHAYKLRPSITTVAEFLNNDERRQRFTDLELAEQVVMLTNILHLFQCVPTSASEVNCKLLGGKEHIGGTSFSTYETDVKLVIPSITGLYQKTIDLAAL